MITTRSKVRIARFISAVIRSVFAVFGASDTVTVRRLGVQWHLDLKEGIDLAIYLSCYERNTLKRYRDLVSPGATILDIGANIGVHALHLAYLVGTQGRVYAVEPTSFAYDKLLDNLGLNPDITERVITCQSMLLASDEATLPEEAVSSWPLTDDAVLTTALAGSPRSVWRPSMD